MNRPSHITIAGIGYDILFQRIPPLRRKDISGFITNPHKAPKIVLETRIRNVDYQRAALFHEIVHGIDHLFLDMWPPLKEQQVLAMSQGLWQTLVAPENAATVKWILKGALP